MFLFINTPVTTVLTIVASMFSIANFSYDPMMVNQLLLSEKFFEYFEPTADVIGLIVAIVSAGTFCAGPFTGMLIDLLGRKRALLLGNLIAIVGVIIQAAAKNVGTLVAGRFILGFSFNITGVAAPSLVAESTPGKHHILLTNLMTMGLPLFGTIMSGGGIKVYETNTDWAWRGAIIGEAGSSLLAIALLPFIPESPRWLIHKQKNTEARHVISCMHSAKDVDHDAVVETEYQQIVQTIDFEETVQKSSDSSWKALVSTAGNRKRFLIVILVNIFTQVSGAATFPYFFTIILQAANITNPMTTLYLNLGLSAWAFVSNAIGIFLCSRIGARRVLLIGTAIMIICLILLAVLTALSNGGHPNYGIGAVVVIFIFDIAGFGIWLIQMYTYPPQVLRFAQRAKAFAISQALGYGFSVMMSYTMPLALENIGWRFYAINAGWNCIILYLVWWLFVETKDKTLEEMDAIFDGTVHFGNVKDTDVTVVQGVEAELEENSGSLRKKATSSTR